MSKQSMEEFADEAAESIVNGNSMSVYNEIIKRPRREAMAIVAIILNVLAEHDRGIFLRFIDLLIRHA